MFKEFFIKEISTGLKRPMVYIFTTIISVLVFFAVTSDAVSIGGSVGNVARNSPHVMTIYVSILSIFGLLMSTAFFNNAALRDYEYKFHEILFSTPIDKFSYYFGRFLGALLLSTIPLLGVFIGFIFGTLLGPLFGMIDADRMGDLFLLSFINNYLLFILPNAFLAGTIIFSVANKWKSTMISFVGTMVIIIAYMVSGTLLSDIDNESIAAITDIFGIRAYSVDSKYFTPIEKNTLIVGFNNLLFINRILWISVGAIILAVSYRLFSFAAKSKRTKAEVVNEKSEINVGSLLAPNVTNSYSLSSTFLQFRSFFAISFNSMRKHVTFKILFVFCVIILVSNLWGGFEYFGLKSYPVTYKMLDVINNSLMMFVIITMVFFSGELIWRDRQSFIHEVVDATPHKSLVSLLAKALSLVAVTSMLHLFMIFVAILYQLLQGYTNIEFSIYFTDFFATWLVRYTAYSLLFVFIQVVVNNKYVGYFVTVIVLLLTDIILSILEIETNMLDYGSVPSMLYSDMNGFGATKAIATWFSLYWILFGVILLLIAGTVVVRGYSQGFKNKIKTAKKNFTKGHKYAIVVVSVIWFLVAGFVYYNTQVLNTYKTSDESEKQRVDYEKKYKKYQNIAQPKIIDTKYDIQIFPKERKLISESVITLVNKSDIAIDSLHYTVDKDWNMEVNIANAKLVYEDRDLGYLIYKLQNTLKVGDSLEIVVTASYIPQGFENTVGNTSIAENGTFINNFTIQPAFGYKESYEISDINDRKKYELPKKERILKLEENSCPTCSARGINYLSDGASDWVNVETVISTSSDQVAIAPGSLLKEWTKNGRNFYHYKLDHKSQNFSNFMSARYEVARKKWNGVDIEVYHHKSHNENVDMMISAVERSLKYYTENFGPYYHKQCRIVEFPRYSTFAQAFPGTMPYSESFGFIVDLEDENDNNVIDAVIAHEMAHQWWAHQEVSAKVQGGTMLTESFAEYSSLMVMKEAVKDDIKMKNFLKYDYSRYLRGRSNELQKELPLYKEESQSYIYYGKGAVVMYALQDYIGEDKVNAALKGFLEEFRYKEPPYPISTDFLRHLEPQVPDSLKYLITDWFKEITLYDFRLKNSTYSKTESNKYIVSVDLEAFKIKADTIGKETKVAINDWVDIGLYSDDDEKNLIFCKRVKLDKPIMNFRFEVDSIPAKAAIDPKRLLIERLISDNVKTVESM